MNEILHDLTNFQQTIRINALGRYGKKASLEVPCLSVCHAARPLCCEKRARASQELATMYKIQGIHLHQFVPWSLSDLPSALH